MFVKVTYRNAARIVARGGFVYDGCGYDPLKVQFTWRHCRKARMMKWIRRHSEPKFPEPDDWGFFVKQRKWK